MSGIPRSLYTAMVLQFAIGGAIMPFITLILRDRGLEFSQISIILFSASSTLLLFPFLWGMLSDRFIPMNRVFTLMNGLALVALLLLSQQYAFWGLLLSFTLFYACFNPTLMLINALCFHHLPNPQQQFAPLRSWGSLGWIIPSLPISAWIIAARSTDLRFVVYLGIALALTTVLTTFYLPHTAPGAKNPGNPQSLGYLPAMKRLMRNGNYLVILASFFLMAGSFTLLVFYSPPFLEDLGVDRAWLGPIQTIGVFFEILLFRWRAWFVSGWKYSSTILAGCLALLLRHVLFATVSDPWILSASYLLAGMVIVFYHIGASILVNSIAGPEVRATAQALLIFFGSGMGPMFANWAAGRIAAWSDDNLRLIFLFAAALAGLASLLIFFRGRKLDEGG